MNNDDEKLQDALKQKKEADKLLLTSESYIAWLLTANLLAVCVIVSFVQMADWLKTVLIAVATVPFIIGVLYAIRIEQKAGYYECKKCGHRYVPTYKSVLFAMHSGRTRYMRCPECGKKSWQKKVLEKQRHV